MTDWDSPNRSRMFLMAALFIAATGAFVSWTSPAYEISKLEATHGSRALVNVTEARALVAAPAEQVAVNAPAAESEELRDAIAAPGASPLVVGAGRAGVFPGGASSARVAAHGPGQAAAEFTRLTAPESAALFAEALQAASGKRQPAREESASGGAPERERLAENRRLLLEWVAQAQQPRRDGLAPARQRKAREDRGAREKGEVSRAPGSDLLIRRREQSESEALERERAARRRAPRFKKPSLSRLLGRTLKPPTGKIAAPEQNPWSRPRPAFGPDGKPIETQPWPLERLDELATPEDLRKACKRKDAHWHADKAGAWMHDGGSWGRLSGAHWAWAGRQAARWWAWTSPDARPVLSHQKRWWLQAKGYWFLMHDGQPWGFWLLERWGQDGFENIAGQQFFYSADGTKLAVVTPGAGAELYDAATGALLGSWTEEELPRRRRPRVPDALPPPR